MYEDEDDQEEGPKSSYITYLAEGDVLFSKRKHYEKAAECYSLALDQKPGDKVCLVARSQCYLRLGDTAKALEDAEEALKEDGEYYKGLYHKAEALYANGDFEKALVCYHKGNKLRPELDQFRLGIQKAEEAINNCIGAEAGVKLEIKGDLSFFQKQDDLKKSKSYTKPKPERTQQPKTTRGKTQKKTTTLEKSCKELLGELYRDKRYLEDLQKDKTITGDGHSPGDPEFLQGDECKKIIYDLVNDGLQYMGKNIIQFALQQQPLYARNKNKDKPKPKGQPKPSDISGFILRSLEEIDTKLADGDTEGSLKQAQNVLKTVENLSSKDIEGKQDIMGNLHSCIGNAYLEMDNVGKALEHHKKDLNFATKTENNDGKSRALDNLGRCYAKEGDFSQAIDVWMEKIPMSKSALESTWLYHEVGRCHLELKNYQDSKEFGQKSLKAAQEAEDQVWQLNATVLISQADVKLCELSEALESFQQALELAKILGDDAAEAAISKAIKDVNERLAEDVKKESDSGKEEDEKEEEEKEESREQKSDEEKKENDTEDQQEFEQEKIG